MIHLGLSGAMLQLPNTVDDRAMSTIVVPFEGCVRVDISTPSISTSRQVSSLNQSACHTDTYTSAVATGIDLNVGRNFLDTFAPSTLRTSSSQGGAHGLTQCSSSVLLVMDADIALAERWTKLICGQHVRLLKAAYLPSLIKMPNKAVRQPPSTTLS